MLKIKLPRSLPELEDLNHKRNVSIVKIVCGEKFYIAKTVNPEWLIREIQACYGKYLRKGILESNLLYPVIKHIYKHEITKITFDVLFTSSNGYAVLKYELEMLIKHFGTPDCLNRNNVPHIPKTELAKKGSNWLTQNQALNFRKLLTKYSY